MDKPNTNVILSAPERDNALEMLKGCITRICFSDDYAEIVGMIGTATHFIVALAESRIAQLQQRESERS